MKSKPLILASTSVYRAALLSRLGLPFEQVTPDVDESAETSTAPATRARKLARAKSEAVARRRPGCWIIGSDQVAACDGAILHKPGNPARQRAQLAQLSARQARFHTAVWLTGPGFSRGGLTTVSVQVRPLDSRTIARYARAEPAHDCAGGFRCEALGITLFDRITSQDPTALEGLPLILTSKLLRAAGFHLP